ncbi:DUF3285 domain-containing protein [Roseofilum reptotaenium CS-1145]|uniref:DUF3285 domain-containing protein n=1 Tax=Roseofilum reptotaenium AO1-A TaxID=1925591 RepID=A0A1L9QPV9_9CYAN|nr:DUF3285 domain-containing protein [Roseofilum reptotaenium]MDB9516637.1 DUF3285 domain-containing protein [Roseofilum reptotaenium CS-1145]OJJ24679.1 DUF3285 domain-containing protein [Roseofilum reptotaenium AO1-A]
MTESETSPIPSEQPETPETPQTASQEPQASYVKLAMRNMVRKGRKSLIHFTLTVIGLLGVLVGLSYLTR